MRSRVLIAASLAALLPLAGTAPAQQQNQPAVPEAPQPQKKPPAKPAPPPDTSADKPAATGDNAFPEEISREAAARAAEQDSTADKPSAAQANPFPEDVSREAAKAAGNDPTPPVVPKSSLPPGVSSSQSLGPAEQDGSEAKPIDPGRANKDIEVGSFYLETGNLQGAFERFKDASAADPTNVNAIFGLAESERLLGKTAEAVQSYQLYLAIVPHGPKARESMKALKTLQAQK